MTKSYILALVIAVIAVLWIGSGYILPLNNDDSSSGNSQSSNTNEAIPDDATADEKAKAITRVRVETVSPQNYEKKITLSGRSVAARQVTLRAETEGQVIAVITDEGEEVSKGDNIVSIDVRERRERLSEAEELVKQRKIEFEAAQKLMKQGFASDVRLAQAQSAYESSLAAMTRARIELEKTTIQAPFDGVLGRRYVDVGDYLRIGDQVSQIVDLDPLEVRVFVNENEVLQIVEGQSAMLQFSGNERRQGVVTYVAPAADMDSRTFQVNVEVENKENPLPAGLTAQVEIAVASKSAYNIKPSSLTLNDAGDVGVKTVGDSDEVAFIPVTVIDDNPQSLWITGLNGDVRVVTVGKDFIIPGQIVEAVEGEGS